MYERKNENSLLCAHVLPTYYCCAIREKRLYLRANILYVATEEQRQLRLFAEKQLGYLWFLRRLLCALS